MANASVGGLVSGLDTATIVSQLMQVEARPQTLLKSKVSSQKTALSSLQALNTKLLAVAAKAGDLAEVAGWSPFTATSSHAQVTARVTSDAATSLTFTVDRTAAAHQLAFAPASLGTVLTTGAPPEVTVSFGNGESTVVDTGDGTLGGLVKALNQPGTGLRAVTIDLGDGTHRVLVESQRSGEAHRFSIKDGDGNDLPLSSTTTRLGDDAQLTIGGGPLRSATNTFAGVVSGLDITLTQGVPPGTSVDITVARDTKGLTDSVQALVDAANTVLTELTSLTASKTSTRAAGALAGDATLRALRDELLSNVTQGADGRSLADVGVQIDREGRILFDAKVFADAYTADPADTAARFAATTTWHDGSTGQATLTRSTWRTAPGTYGVDATSSPPMLGGFEATLRNGVLTGKAGTPVEGLAVTVTSDAVGTLTYRQGFAARLAAVAERASDSSSGTVTTAIKGRTSTIDSLEDAIAGWDVRLTRRREALERQYAALEVALGQLQNQSSWLAGQIAGLPSYNSGS